MPTEETAVINQPELEEEADALLSAEDRPESEYPWILFTISDTVYGVNSKYVLSIERLVAVTPIVESAGYCPGITEFRSDMISLVDLRSLFGYEDYSAYRESKGDEKSMMVVVEYDCNSRGVIVDEIVSAEYITNFVESMSGSANTLQSEYIRKVAKREKTEDTILILREDLLSSL